ncbi:protein MOR1 [Citrus sinensis]|uniref:Protein MOR1 n=1 Tax=Citrus sinensis TaxID=2711 RepID=A0ACB8NE73_CITSI|nr:protein MOR1 [Citrus sinensis]
MSEEEKLLKEAKKLPWEDRLLHKNWKVRNEANIDLAALCDSITDPKDNRIRELGPLFKKTVADSNAPVQDKALDALIAYLKAADADAGRYAKEVCDAIAAKCLTGRPKTVEKAQAVFMLWVELEAVDVFLDVMEKAIKNKVAKAVVPAIDVMFQALSEFGAKIIPPKRILKMLPELFDHQDQNVRASSKGLTLELCRWIGKDPVKTILFEKMRDTMKKELEVELVNVSGTARPTRKIRAEQDKELGQELISEDVGPGPSEESTADVPPEIDEYELVDPVDILTPLEKSGFWEGVVSTLSLSFNCCSLKATKWSERKDAVAELTKLASTKRIAPGDFTEVCRTLKKCYYIVHSEMTLFESYILALINKLITDVNIAVAVEAIQAIGNLARGLRTHFSGSSRFLLPVLLVNVKTSVKNKVPLVRSLTLNWVTFCIETSSKAAVLKVHKDYVPICMECLNDGTPEVRDAAFSVLAAIAKSVGMRPLERSIEKLDDVRRNKLSEMIAGSGGDVATGTSSARVQTSGGSVPSVELLLEQLCDKIELKCSVGSISGNVDFDFCHASESSFVRKSAASMLSGKRPVSAAPASKKGGPVKPSAKKDGSGKQETSKLTEAPEDVEPSEMSLEEIESRLGSLIPADTVGQLKSAVWKERLEAISSLRQQVEAVQNLDQSVEILVRLVCMLPGWSEKNVQVQQQVIEVINYLAATATKFPKKCVVLCLLGGKDAFIVPFSSSLAGLVLRNKQLYKIMKDHKNPKVLSEGILWMVSAVEDFGVSHLKLKDLIDFCKDTGLQSSAAATRNATIKLLGALHKFVGPDIKGFLADVKPALLSALDAEYEKNPFEGTVVPKKTVRASESTSSVSSGGSDGLPREDISGKITPTLVKSLESPDWKVRLESIEAVNKILEEANKRIQPAGTGNFNIWDHLDYAPGRLYDSNKNLVMATLITLGAVASAMGPAVEKSSKGVLSDILKCLGDNKKHMRECTLTVLDAWLAAVHLDKMVPYVTTALTDAKLGAEGRKDLFDWLSKQLTGLSGFPDAAHLLKPASIAMTDKSSDVRKAAEACIVEILRAGGQETIEKNLKDIQGPALALILERIKLNGASQVSMGPTSKSSSKVPKSASNGVSKHGNRAISSRVIPTKGARPESIMSVQDFAVQSQALLNVKDSNKEDRERMVVRRFKFEDPRIEQIQELENDMMKYFREDLHRRLLSTDFKKQVDGLEMLQKALPSIRKDIIEVLDILLRWFVLQFCKSNTTCLLKVLEFLPELFDTLRDEGYSLTESEAAVFLPCLVEKISGQLKSLQIVASLTAERDGEIRKAALNTLATGYKILGEDIWRYVGKLTDAQKSMLDDRFKWKVREMEKKKEGKPGEARAALRRSVRENGSDIAEQSGDVSQSVSGPTLMRRNYGHSELHVERSIMPRALASVSGPTDWNEALDIISFGSPEQSVEGMKVVCHELAQATNDPEGSVMDELVKDADRLVSCLANKVAKTFDFSLTGASSRSCKYVLNTLMQTFQNKRLAYAVQESTLDSLITELLLWLLDERVPHMDDGSQLLKALNVLMLKILDNADRTSSFVVLINLLRPLDPSRWPSPASNESFAARNQRFSDLVVKCLIKLTKVLQSTIYDVDLDRILQSIHVYLQELGMEEIRRRAGADDKPLRMVKTVLHELVKLRGAAIKGHLSMVPIDMKPQPIILAYIDLNLETLAAARMLTSTGPGGQTHWGDSAANNPTSATNSADAQLKQELAAIFKKIGDKQTCTIGLYELYRITQLYPKVDIFAQLQNASEAFRTYIRDGLAQMEKNAAAGRTPSSVPMATPPPAALGVSSPEFAPLSPVHTNSMNDAKSMNVKSESTNFNLPPSYTEDNRIGGAIASKVLPPENPLSDQRNERFGVTSGTLDAIRERMKSMQLAAAAGNPDPGNRPLINMNDNVNNGLSSQSRSSDRASVENPAQGSVLPMDEKALSGLQARMERLKSGTIEPL